jgi:serine/threonine protein phosphatase PrpC
LFEDTIVEEDIHPVYVSAGLTDVGRLRSSNQDAYKELVAGGLWVVADGMGGYRDGDVASRMVCDAVQDIPGDLPFERAIDTIRQRMSDVNSALHSAAIRPVDPVVSGSTVAMFLVRRTSCAMLWAGDSRIYRLRHSRLTQLTSDHTWAAELNLQQPGEEADHAITRAVGGEDTLLLDVRRDRVRLGDRYLLCSDGLTHELHDEQIAALLGEGEPQACAKSLIDATLETGARDNVTVIVIDAQ